MISPSSTSRERHLLPQHPAAGAAPGTLLLPDDASHPSIHVISYDATTIDEHDVAEREALEGHLADDRVTWIDVQGLGNEETLLEIGRLLGLHSLALEDIVHVPQRPRCDAYDDHVIVFARMLRLLDDGTVDVEQISMIVGERFVVTFQERPGDVLDAVRARLRASRGRIRSAGTDYLAYAFLDAIVDGYYPVLEHLGDRIVELENDIFDSANQATLQELSRTRRNLLAVRRSTWPLRDALSSLIRDESRFFSSEVRIFLRDVYDHTVHTVEVIEAYRELSAGLMNTYLSVVSNRMNEVMKVLTIMATIFIPLTFVAGVYGMNFDHMPELHSRWGYPIVLGVMLGSALALVYYFWRKGWLGSESE